MDLEMYLWHQRITAKVLAEKLQLTPCTLSNIRNGRFSPTILNARKIIYFADGLIKLEDLLSKKDHNIFYEWTYQLKD